MLKMTICFERRLPESRAVIFARPDLISVFVQNELIVNNIGEYAFCADKAVLFVERYCG